MKKHVFGVRYQLSAVALLALLWASGLPAQVSKQVNERYQTKEGRESIAKDLAKPDRDEKDKPKELVQAMTLQPGMIVADLGTGVGYMLPYLSEAVGPAGRVIAEDIFTDFLHKAEDNSKQHKLANVTFVHGGVTDPSLPENGVDVALALDSYHHWDYPEKMLAALHRELRAGGRLVIADYYKRPGAMPNGAATSLTATHWTSCRRRPSTTSATCCSWPGTCPARCGRWRRPR